MKHALALLAGIAWAATPLANAQAQQANETIEVFTEEDLRRALDTIQASYEPSSNNRTINVKFASGLHANAELTACTDKEKFVDCHATSILAAFAVPEGSTSETIAKAITQYNYRENFGRAYISPQGKISARIYIISDGGITPENYARQIRLWEASLSDFSKYLFNPE